MCFVSNTPDARARKAVKSSRSMRIPSSTASAPWALPASAPVLSGCGRRVLEKRRSSASSEASRNSTVTSRSPGLEMALKTLAASSKKRRTRTSMPNAIRRMPAAANAVSVEGTTGVGRLSTQK